MYSLPLVYHPIRSDEVRQSEFCVTSRPGPILDFTGKLPSNLPALSKWDMMLTLTRRSSVS